MDWEVIAKQQKELEMSFEALKQIFEQAQQAFKVKQGKLAELFSKQQSVEAQNLAEIHNALSKILKSAELG